MHSCRLDLNTLKLALGLAAVGDVVMPGQGPVVLAALGVVGGYMLLKAHNAQEASEARKFADPFGGLGVGYIFARTSGYPPSSALIAGIAVMAAVMYMHNRHKQKKLSDHPPTFSLSNAELSHTCPSGSGRGRHTNYYGFGNDVF